MSESECPSCGVAYTEHMGLAWTCADLQRERRATLEAAGEIGEYIEEVRRLREENSRMLEAIRLHLRHHEHGCSYLGEFVDYEEIYR